MELALDSLVTINGWAEANDDGNYRVEGNIVSKWFDGSIKQMLYKPSFMNLVYRGGHHEWDNNFDNIESSQLQGHIHYRSSVVQFSPGLTFTRLRNYIYYDQVTEEDSVQQVFPVQSSGNQIILSPEVRFSLTFFRHVTWSNRAIYTRLLENAGDAIRVPELLLNTQLAYANILFNGNLDMHAGVELSYRSAYFAPAYDPALRQFYNQDTFEVNAYPLVDVFLNAKIKRARIFVKWHNVSQFFTEQGYFATPFYPGQRNVVDFGFDWSFYD